MAKVKHFFDCPMYNGCAIYAIINRKKMSVYVGQTKDLKRRAETHDKQLHENKHANKELQAAANSGDKLDFITLLRMPGGTSETELKLLEKLFMLDFSVSGFTLYNKTMSTRESIMHNIIIDLSMHYKTSDIISDEYMNKYGNHYCYDVLKSR